MEAIVTAPVAGATRDYSAEVKQIAQMCAANNCSDKMADFVANGLTPDQVGHQILDLYASKKITVPGADQKQVDMGKDAGKYSFLKAINAACDIREGRKASGLEVEISQDIARTMPVNYEAKGGIFIPMTPQNTSLTSGGSTTGAELVRTQYGDLIELLRAQSFSTRMGATLLAGLTGPLTFPKQTGAATLYWTGENPGSDVTGSNITTGSVTLSPKTAMATSPVSRQLIVQSTPNAEQLMRNDLGIIAALGIDRAVAHGAGANNEPDGLYHLSNVNATAMGGVPTFGKIVDMATSVANYNALLGNLGFVTTPGMAGKLMQTLVASAAGSKMIWEGTHIEGVMAGYKALATNQVSSVLGTGTDEHGILFGNWADIIIGQWGGIEIIVDPFTSAKKGLIEITMHMMVDVIARHAQSFAKATGAKIA